MRAHFPASEVEQACGGRARALEMHHRGEQRTGVSHRVGENKRFQALSREDSGQAAETV